MKSNDLRQKFISFFEANGHKVIPSASLVPENDPTVLFTTAGMHPLVPYLLGENHPEGKRLVSCQKCIRTDDIDEVGDKVHHTFFEMLGNWSLGDYFKKESIAWSYEFLISEEYLNIPVEKLAISVFEGDSDAPFDQESYDLWLGLGIKPERIAKLPKKNNWWGPAGASGPCGPDTEIFYWTGEGNGPENFQKTESDSNWVEIWNNVFMEYFKTTDAKFELLKQKNVDTGMGFDRTLAVLNNLDDNYKTDLFWPIIEEIEKLTGKKYIESEIEFRIIADHMKAAIFAINDGAIPSNKNRGYISRRLIRRAVVKANELKISNNFGHKIAQKVFEIYDGVYEFKKEDVLRELEKEETKFRNTLERGLKQFKLISCQRNYMEASHFFYLYESFGFPFELSLEEAKKREINVDENVRAKFLELQQEHQDLSRTTSAGMFKGGLADSGEETKKLHTAAHLMLASLRKVLGDGVFQKGSNITPERLRFDFSYSEKMTDEQIKAVEELVNDQIQKDLPVTMAEMKIDEAKNSGAMGVFDSKYADMVKVYTIGDFSREICGGPHVENTGNLGHFKIVKEESSSAGIRRIKAVLE